MKMINSRLILYCLVMALVLTGICPVFVQATETQTSTQTQTTGTAIDISSAELLTASSGIHSPRYLFDGISTKNLQAYDAVTLTLEYAQGMGSFYLQRSTADSPFTVTDNATGEVRTVGENLFYHEFVDLVALFGTAPTSITICFPEENAKLTELSVFTPGEVPDHVQKWQLPAEGQTDLLLYVAHGDDDQIFFAGILPYYSEALGYNTQVVYMTNHYNTGAYRVHEMLDGLWACGVEFYPIFGSFPDFYGPSAQIEPAYKRYQKFGYSRENLVGFVVEQLRRFRPQVVVTHDFMGEYGHPQHMVCADLMSEAVTVSQDAAYYPETVEIYGLWDVPKTYIHMYEENPIFIDLDTPLDALGGMTPFNVSKEVAFPLHKSQYQMVDFHIVPYETAAEMKRGPCNYGLYRSTVGEDVEKNDFFENVLTYGQQAQIESERLAAEEARLEAERLAAEQAAQEARLEAERLEAERLAAEQAAAEARAAREASQRNRLLIGSAAIAVICLTTVLCFMLLRRKKQTCT